MLDPRSLVLLGLAFVGLAAVQRCAVARCLETKKPRLPGRGGFFDLERLE